MWEVCLSKGKVLYKSSVKYPFLKRGIIPSRTQVSTTWHFRNLFTSAALSEPYCLAWSYSAAALVNVHSGDSWRVASYMSAQVWPGSSVFLWGEWRLQAGDLWGGDLLEGYPKEVTEDLRLCPMHFPRMWPLLRKLMGLCALQQANHHHRQVHLLISCLKNVTIFQIPPL